MGLMEKFAAQRGAFENAYVHGDWTPLEAFFHEDVTYEVMNMPFHCVVQGRTAMLDGMRRSIAGFDKHCIRTLGINTVVREEGRNVLVWGGMRYERDGAPPLSSRLWEIATYRDGLIERLVDIYEDGAEAAYEEWMSCWGEGLDPRYV